RIVPFVVRAFGPATVAVIHYGSHAHRADARAESEYDFFVIVDGYGRAFGHLARRLGTTFSPWTAVALAHWLPPTVIALTARVQGDAVPVKCSVYSAAHFGDATATYARDHFAQARLC